MDSAVVIKVKYGDTLRRFTAYVDENGILDLDMGRLKVKIQSLFEFAPDADVTLTYIDEDNDVVTLVDDDDLCDATRQNLNPLRINVQLNSIRAGRSESRFNRSSTFKGSPRVEHPLSHIDSGVAEVLKSAQEPIFDAFSKISYALSTKATSLVLTKFVECLSKLELSHLCSISACQDGASLSREKWASECPMGIEVNEEPESAKNMATPKVLLNAKLVDPSPANFQKGLEAGNMTRAGRTSVPPTTALVDLNADHLRNSIASEYSTLNIPPPVSASVALSHDEKAAQKGDVHLNGNSISSCSLVSPANVQTHVNLHPFQASETPFLHNRGPCVLNGDNNKNLPRGIEQSFASHVGVNHRGISPNNGQIGVDSCHAVPLRYTCVRPFNNSYNNSDSVSRIFHKGIRCDGCGVYPIMGSRFKSIVKEDSDLCSICFLDLGNEAEYIRLDHPVSRRSPWSSKDFYDPAWREYLLNCRRMRSHQQKLDSYFVRDVNVTDGAVMAPNVPFTKIWRIRNNGATAWPRGTQLVWIGGDQFTDGVSVEVEIPVDGFPVDKELDIAVDFTAPEQPGWYISYWRMSLPSDQKFGQPIWVFIKVDTSLQGSADSSHGFNLNFPPQTCMAEGKEIRDLNVVPVEGSLPQNWSL